MNKFTDNIDKQIEFNKGKNIFLENTGTPLKFRESTISAMSDIKELRAEMEPFIVDYATDKAIEEFCRVNQYYSFNSQARNDLREIYYELFSTIKAGNQPPEAISTRHYRKIKEWLQQTNPFAEKIYTTAASGIEPVPCFEYSPELQLNILNINLDTLMEPVLDIGCGKQGNLVRFLQQKNIAAFGLDRFSFDNQNLISADWLEYRYESKKWGTIISNLGFSNHFKHHHQREDGNYIEYARKYMEILNSLKSGGCFYYAPDLPFIEKFLNDAQFRVEKFQIENYHFKAVRITRAV
jgi:hypothetical protein